MIKLEKVNKYYNRGRSNQIHVIDNTTMTLPDNGIMCLLGPSGCGKTTLLNVIGGLDKINSGKIIIDGERISNRRSAKVDTIRNAKIGYIFQNFNLLDDKSVFENVAMALRMVGIKDKKIIEERVNYCLKSVGMYQFRRKDAGSLSGGQRQRVAIARAIVKNPSIIIADEPTGNLDSSNTLEIMNIIKSLSKDKLVLLVTHEKNIADFYSDYVVEILDGKIVNSYANDSSGYLDYQLENRIFLRDMKIQEIFDSKGTHLRFYGDKESKDEIKLVIRGNNIFIDTGGKYNVVDENTSIELIDDNYKTLDESIFEQDSFDYQAYLPDNFKPKYKSVYNIFNMIGKGWKTIRNFKLIKKLLLLGFVFAAAFTFLAISKLLGLYEVKPSEYMSCANNYITVSNPKKTDDLITTIEKMENTGYVIPGNSRINVSIPFDDYYQSTNATVMLDVSLAYSEVMPDSSLILGHTVENPREIVIDKVLAKTILKDSTCTSLGITRYKQLLEREVVIPNLKSYVIVGICDTESPVMYVNRSQAMYILTNAQFATHDESGELAYDDTDSEKKVVDIKLADSNPKIKKGRMPEKAGEVIVNDSYEYEYKINKKISEKMYGEKLTLVGFYTSDKSEDKFYVTADTIKKDYISKNKKLTVYSDRPEAMLEELKAADIDASIMAQKDRSNYDRRMKDSLTSSLMVVAVILLVSLIELFLMLRSSFLSRIKEVGILRAIGLKKKDIYRMFTGEIITITFITAIPGIALMYFIMSNVVNITSYLECQYMIKPIVAIVSFGVVLLFNLLVGLIPVRITLAKTPAQILARTDI